MAPRKQQKPNVVTNDNNGNRVIAPWPIVDRYPTVIGSNLTLTYLSSVYRICTTGYRQQWVDVLNELIERDPFAYAVVAQRINAVAGGRIDVVPAKTQANTPDERMARVIADDVANQIDSIPRRTRSLASMHWSIFYGVAGLENCWDRTSDGWRITEWGFVHSRRIAYPSQDTWDARIWDQGQVGSMSTIGTMPTESLYGIRVKDWPGKFILETPQIRGDYPTREGLGREIAFWMALKGMAIRGGAQFIERFAKPWSLGYYATQNDGKPRTATPEDIAAADSALKALGIGSLSGATLPDSIKVMLEGPGAKATSTGVLPHVAFIEFIDRQVATAVLGNSDLTSAGPNGARSSTETRKDGTRELYRCDAACLGDTLTDDVARWIVHLNYPGFERLTPRVNVIVDEKPNPLDVIEVATKFAASGAPVDADKMADRIGVDLVPNITGAPRRLAVLKPVTPFELDAGQAVPKEPHPATTEQQSQGTAPAEKDHEDPNGQPDS